METSFFFIMTFKRKTKRVVAVSASEAAVKECQIKPPSKTDASPAGRIPRGSLFSYCTINNAWYFFVVINIILFLIPKSSSGGSDTNLRQVVTDPNAVTTATDGGSIIASKEAIANDPPKVADPVKATEAAKPVSITGGKMLDAMSIEGVLNSGKTNVALKKTATQSDTFKPVKMRFKAENAIDGNRLAELSHTKGCDPWWQVDLGSVHDVTDIIIFNRVDMFQAQLSDFYVGVLNQVSGNWEVAAQIHHRHSAAERAGFHFEPAAKGQIVRIHMGGCKDRFIHVIQVEVYGTLA